MLSFFFLTNMNQYILKCYINNHLSVITCFSRKPSCKLLFKCNPLRHTFLKMCYIIHCGPLCIPCLAPESKGMSACPGNFLQKEEMSSLPSSFLQNTPLLLSVGMSCPPQATQRCSGICQAVKQLPHHPSCAPNNSSMSTMWRLLLFLLTPQGLALKKCPMLWPRILPK